MFREPIVQLVITVNAMVLTALMNYAFFGAPAGLLSGAIMAVIVLVLMRGLWRQYNAAIDRRRR